MCIKWLKLMLKLLKELYSCNRTTKKRHKNSLKDKN